MLDRGYAQTSENSPSEQLGDFEECTRASVSRLLLPKILPGEQPLEAHPVGTIAQHSVET
jgi:hypothetical protein